jgi:nucleoside-diphosphate-sugar epimerase
MPTKPLEVLVTGATGLTGSHTTRALLAAGHSVRALIRSQEKARRVFSEAPDRLRLVQGDIGDQTAVRDALRDCDAVIHCAAVVAAGRARNPDEVVETNVDGVRNVIGGAMEQGLSRIVHVSSLATLFRGDGTALTESSEPQGSEHAYGRSKAMSDRYVRALQDAGHPIEIVYPGAIIGPDDPGLSESMLALRTFIDDFIPLTTAGMQLVDARDLADAHLKMVERGAGGGRYLVAGTFLTWRELAEALENATGEELRKVRFPGAVLRALGRMLDLVRKVVPVELPLTAESAAYVTRWDPVPSSSALASMGVTFRPVRESIDDAVQWMRQAGHL